MTSPIIASPGRDQPAGTLLRRGGRDGKVPVGHSELDQHVQPVQRLIVGDVFLGLVQRQARRGVWSMAGLRVN